MSALLLAESALDNRIGRFASNQARGHKVTFETNGPRVIAVASRTSDCVMLTLGAKPKRIAGAGLDLNAIATALIPLMPTTPISMRPDR